MNPGTENGQSEQASVLDAPDYAKLLKGSGLSASAREYETKIESAVKAGVLGCLRNGNIEDAATLLHYGSDFASATAELTDESKRAKQIVDILTAPDNAYFVFAAVAMPMVLQFFRNHEQAIHDVSLTRKQMRAAKRRAKQEGTYVKPEKHPVTIPLLFGRKLTVNIRFRIPLASGAAKFFRAQTRPPEALVKEVFSDKKVRDTLKKNHGIEIRFEDETV